MKTVTTKKELINAINNGEQHIKINSNKLYAACLLAEKYQDAKSFKQRILSELVSGSVVNITETVAIAITISTLVTLIAILGILKDKKVKIKCKYGTIGGEVEIG